MKIILFLIFSLSLTVGCFCQNLGMKQDSTNIYYHALREVISKRNNQTVYVEYDYVLNSFFDKLPFSCSVKLLSQKDMIDMTKRNKSIVVYKLFPMSFDGEYFRVGIVPFGVKSKKNHLFYENGGSWHIRYIFNCSNNQLQFKETKFFGI
ncbi:hypothetical protein [Spirosoma sp. KNUC1025]|uniref:hypothetical protein n=1 Tax=Spirosoma sp. KNUC1025 TaxID=2894082 RepID=UPI003868293C|nr:hypothetical protein LN737_17215 [Spirosoma sp. KNUC1025]